MCMQTYLFAGNGSKDDMFAAAISKFFAPMVNSIARKSSQSVLFIGGPIPGQKFFPLYQVLPVNKKLSKNVSCGILWYGVGNRYDIKNHKHAHAYSHTVIRTHAQVCPQNYKRSNFYTCVRIHIPQTHRRAPTLRHDPPSRCGKQGADRI